MQYLAYKEHLKAEFKEYYRIITENAQIFETRTQSQYFEMFAWAQEFLTTRGFGYGMQQTALVPMLDYLNHSDDASKMTKLNLVNHDFELDRSKYQEYLEEVSKKNQLTGKELVQYDFIAEKYDLKPLGIQFNKDLTENQIVQQKQQQVVASISSSQDQSQDEAQPQHHKVYPPITHLALCSERDIKEGEQILLHYGCRNNLYLLKWYGFTLLNNKYDSFSIWASPVSEDVFLSPIERPSIQIKLKMKRISLELINFSRKFYYEKYYKLNKLPKFMLFSIPKDLAYEKVVLEGCLRRLKNLNFDPEMLVPETSPGDKYINIYLQTSKNIYDKQIYYFEQSILFLQQQLSLKQNQEIFNSNINNNTNQNPTTKKLINSNTNSDGILGYTRLVTKCCISTNLNNHNTNANNSSQCSINNNKF